MIRLYQANEAVFHAPNDQIQHPKSSRVSWFTQKRAKQSQNNHPHSQDIKNSSPAPKKQILAPTLLPKDLNLFVKVENQPRNHHHFQNIHISLKNSSQKQSTEKKQKLSLMSKRSSSRKISNFISFQPEALIPFKQDHAWDRIALNKQISLNKQVKKSIKIEVRRQCLAQLSKNDL